MKKDIRLGLNEAYRMLHPYRVDEQQYDVQNDILLDKIYEIHDTLSGEDQAWDSAVDDAMESNGVGSFEELLEAYPEGIEDLIKFGRERLVEIDPEVAVDEYLEDKVRSDVQSGEEKLEQEDINFLARMVTQNFPQLYPTFREAKWKVEDWLEQFAVPAGEQDYGVYGDYGNYYSKYDPVEEWIDDRVRTDVKSGKTPMTVEDIDEFAPHLQKAFPDKFPTVEDAKKKIQEYMQSHNIKTLEEDPMAYLEHYIDSRKAVGYGLYPDFGAQFAEKDIDQMAQMMVDKFGWDPAKARDTVVKVIDDKNVTIHEMRRLAGGDLFLEQKEYEPEDDEALIARKEKEAEEQRALDKHVDAEIERWQFRKHGEEPEMDEVAPPGAEYVVKGLKKSKVKSPWAVAWAMRNKGAHFRKGRHSGKKMSDIGEASKFGFPTPEEAKDIEAKIEQKMASMIYDLGEEAESQINKEQMDYLVNNLMNAFPIFKTSEQARHAVEVYLYKNKIPVIGESLKKKLHEGGESIGRSLGKIPLKRSIPKGELNPSQIAEADEEESSPPYLDPQNIYDFYAIEYMLSKSPSSSYDFRLGEIQRAVLDAYKRLVINQIGKYVERGRYVGKKKVSSLEGKTMEQLLSLMKDTRRSDMERSNIRWEYLTDHLIRLSESRDIRMIISTVDRIFNATHNTKTNVLDKFQNGPDLLRAFDECHNARSLAAYSDKVSPELRDDVMAHRSMQEMKKRSLMYGKRTT